MFGFFSVNPMRDGTQTADVEQEVARNVKFTESGENSDSEPLSVMVNVTDVASLVRQV